MKQKFHVTLVLLAALSGCKTEDRSREPIFNESFKQKESQKKAGPTAAPVPAGTPTPTPQADLNITCNVINVLHGDRDRADTTKTIKVSISDESRSDTLSTNSENTVFFVSNKGTITLRVEARKDGYTRGQIEFPMTASAMALSPDNQTDATGFVDVRCANAPVKSAPLPAATASPNPATTQPSATTAPTPAPVAQKFKWSCSALGYADPQGEEEVYTKDLEFSAGEAAKSVVILDSLEAKLVKIEAYTEGSMIGVRYGVKGVATDKVLLLSAGTVDASSASLTLYKPKSGSLSRYKVACKKL